VTDTSSTFASESDAAAVHALDDGAIGALEIRGLERRYGRFPVLRGIDLDVARGRIVALLGANGVGKTTLLRVLATRLRPSAGYARVYGHDVVTHAHEARTRLATLAVFGGSYGTLTARENLHLVTALRGAPTDGIDAALARVGLTRVADHLTRTFSSGMRKRLGLARLLLAQADLWLLDEPHAALDEEGRALVDTLVLEARAAGGTVVMATHEGERAQDLADATLVLEEGRLARAAAVPT
jgi:heme ABC exporter ATP-binding subunit CcmA